MVTLLASNTATSSKMKSLLSGISIIVPCYNAGDYLRKCIDSILKQNFDTDKFEIIIVDDCSSDQTTRNIIEELSDSTDNIRVLINSKNSGVSATRNRAIRMAQYQYILPIDADDELCLNWQNDGQGKGYLQEAFELMQSDEDLLIAYCGARYIGAMTGRMSVNRYDQSLILFKNMIPVFGVYRTDEALAIGGYDEGLQGFEDWYFWICMINQRIKQKRNIRVTKIDKDYYLYRQHHNAISISQTHSITLPHFYRKVIKNNQALYSQHKWVRLKMLYTMIYVKIPSRFKGTGIMSKIFGRT